MKKNIALLGAIALAGAFAGGPTVIQSNGPDARGVTVTPSQKQDKSQLPAQQDAQQIMVRNYYGGLDLNPYWRPSRSPKEYGQWLQRTGRQKGVKKGRA